MTRDEVIEKFLPYAKSQAKYWSYRYPFIREDVYSVALLALVEVANRTLNFNKSHLASAIKNKVTDLIGANNLIHIPRTELDKRKKENQPTDDLPKARLLGDESFFDLRVSKDPPTWMQIHLKDVAKILELDKRESKIIEMKIEGYTNEEIGEHFDIHESMIRKILKKLQGRYLVATRDYPGIMRPRD